MKTITQLTSAFLIVGATGLSPLPAFALILVGHGNRPVSDAGWPDGALELANLQSRVGWWEGPPFGGGQWQFLYRGDTAALTQALTNFAAIRAPAVELVIHDGPEENVFLKDSDKTNSDTRVDWKFTVWNPASWHRLYNNPKSVFMAGQREFRQPVDAPRLDVYLGGGQVDWTKVQIPPTVRVRDERAAAAGVDLSGGSVVRAEFYDMDSGKPISGVRLLIGRVSPPADPKARWSKEHFAEAVSDSSGGVQIDKIPAGTIRVSATADGYAPRYLDQRTHGRPELLKFSVELAKTAGIRGTVMDVDGRPIRGAKVRTQTEIASNGRGYDDGRHYDSPDTWSAETDDDGRFELTGLPTGYAQLYVSAPGYHFNDHLMIHDVPSTNITLRLAGAGGIRVTVTDKSGNAVARFENRPLMVFVEPKEKPANNTATWGGGATVKDDGTCEFNDVPPGEYRVVTRTNPGRTDPQHAPEQVITVKLGAPTSVKVVYE